MQAGENFSEIPGARVCRTLRSCSTGQIRASFSRGSGSKSRFALQGVLGSAARPGSELFERLDGLAQCLGSHSGQGMKASADELAFGGDKAVGEAAAL